MDWDGLDENGQPIVEVQNVKPDELDRLKLKTATVEQLTRTLPVNLLQVTVAAGKERLFANFDRAVETAPDKPQGPSVQYEYGGSRRKLPGGGLSGSKRAALLSGLDVARAMA